MAIAPYKVQAARDFGLQNINALVYAAETTRLSFAACCALLEMESNGRNVFGHDAGGALSGYPGTVNKSNYDVFRWMVVDQGMPSNGVGPCQITWWPFFAEMEAKGLKPWRPEDNMLFGFGLMKTYRRGNTWEEAGRRYNGSPVYGKRFAAKVKEWQKRFAEAKGA